MPAFFFFGLFSFLMAMMSAVVLEISQSRQELTQQLAGETEAYFKRIHDMVQLDMVPNALEILPRPASTATVADQSAAGQAFLIQDDVRRLTPPNLMSDPLKDSWGIPLTVRIIKDNSALDPYTTAPVYGFFIHSAGADSVSQTLINDVDTMIEYQNVTAEGDDIVMFFKTLDPLKKVHSAMYNDLNFIKGVMERDFNTRFQTYRDQKINTYYSDTSQPAPDFKDLAATDTTFPKMLDVSQLTQRRRLGADEVFTRLERTLPSGGRMRVRTIGNTTVSVTFGLVNDTINPSPWPALGPRVTAYAVIE